MISLLVLCGLATAQEDPWDKPSGEVEAVPEEGAPSPPPPFVIEDLDTPTKDRSKRSPNELTPQGHRISPLGGSHNMALAQDSVLGGDGGTNVTTLYTRIAFEDYAVAVSLPFAAYRTPDGRTTDLGNLLVEGLYTLPSEGIVHAVGVDVHFNPGGQPFTWANEAEELWPGAGVNALYQMRMGLTDDTALLLRGSLGIHTSQGFEPFHKVYPRIGASAAIDQTIAPLVGIVGETTLSYWDVSPWELAGLIRVDPVTGIRARGGFLLPVLTWAGATPIDRPGGIREVTLLLDIQMAI
jgi:hypothetical protein